MPDTILVIVEQREGKLNRVSWETLTAGQALAAETGWTLEAAVAGSSVASFANEIASKKVAKVYALEAPKLEPYTPDAFANGLKQFIASKQPKLVLLPLPINAMLVRLVGRSNSEGASGSSGFLVARRSPPVSSTGSIRTGGQPNFSFGLTPTVSLPPNPARVVAFTTNGHGLVG